MSSIIRKEMFNKQFSCKVKGCKNPKNANTKMAFLDLSKEPARRMEILQSFGLSEQATIDSHLYAVCQSHLYLNSETSQSLPSGKLRNTVMPPDTDQHTALSPKIQPSTSKAEVQEIERVESDDMLLREYKLGDCAVKIEIIDSDDENDMLNHSASNTFASEFSNLVSLEKGMPNVGSSTTETISKENYSHDTTRGQLLISFPATPCDMYELFINDSFMAAVADETNKYAQSEEEMCGKEYWIDTNAQELKVFLGLILHMGTFRFRQISDYWALDKTFFNTQFENYMPQQRFQELLKNLTFASDEASSSADRFWEVRPIIDNFNNVMNKSYKPDELVIADKTAWHEREYEFFLQTVGAGTEPIDPHSILYMLREPTGAIIKLNLHSCEAGSESERIDDIIYSLVADHLHLYSTIYLPLPSDVDKSCCKDVSGRLSDELTLRLPMFEARRDTIVEAGASQVNKVAEFSKSSFTDIIATWEMDANRVLYFLSTPEKMPQKPMESYQMWAAKWCSAKMDYHDIYYYPLQKAAMAYHRKFFLHFLMLSLLNSYHIYTKVINSHHVSKKPRRSMDFFDFRMEVITSLLPSSPPEPIVKSRKMQVPHHLDSFPLATQRAVCVACKKRSHRTLSNYYCRECPKRPALCVECFCDVHC